MKRIAASLMLAMSLCYTTSAVGADTHPFSIHDMLAMERIGDPQVSPDGSRIVFTLRTTDLEANRGRTDLWLVGSDGSGLRRLTSHPDGDFNPRWSTDGKDVYFLSTRSDASQVWRISVAGGEAQQVTHQPLDVGSLAISPTGTHLAISMEVYPDGASPQETRDRLDEIAARKASGQLFDKMFIRHWDTWKDGRRAHVFALPVSGGDAIDVMKGMDADCPTKPFGGPEDYTFTPDGKGIVFGARDVGRDEPWSTDFDLYVASIAGGVAPRCLTEANKAWDMAPTFSPDGKTLAYLAMERAGYESDRLRIILQEWPSGNSRTLAPNWDRSAGSITWSNDGGTLYATASNLGQRSLFAINVAVGTVTTVVKEGTVRAVGMAGERIMFSRDNLQSPVELFSIDTDGMNERAVTRINADKVAAARMGDYEQFTFLGWNDEKVYGYVVKPVDFDPSKKYPVAFLIHGGPQGSFGNDFHYRWNPQAYTGAGYAAVMVDFHGSTGYGQAFCDSIRGDWGGKPLVDLKKGLAAALNKYPWMDRDHVSALGASYGGYMINWIAGNWPNRFRCLINHDGNLDERMAYYDTEELWFPEWDHLGTPWDNPAGYARHNPIDHVKNWKTPMLVIHGAKDYRVVDTQGMSTFTALQRRGIPSKFLYFPDENHWVLSPANGVLWHETVIGWLDQWTK
ncbi:MAG: S9 family peptidase [Planctomycetes bacterium]|nr:S9 family peptidase [Planctomycetota bacterium]